LQLNKTGEASASNGTIVAQVYQGGHVDLYVECADSSRGRVLVRLSGHEAMTSWPTGAQVGISLNADEAIAFAIA
jgi:hypothetical protein